MAKPKFELTSDLVKVEPEPQETETRHARRDDSVTLAPPPAVVATDKDLKPDLESRRSIFPDQTPTRDYPFDQAEERRGRGVSERSKIERQPMSLQIAKDLKKRFHLHCVQNGLSMTDAIEIAILEYLKESERSRD